jgi:ribulose-5-phosphate 4-epimerase/fuculose-1-phosphate aldolase
MMAGDAQWVGDLAKRASMAFTEAEARDELAALYHLLDEHVGRQEGIYTHVTLRVPRQLDHMLIKRHIDLYSEVTAENLVKVPIGADVDESFGVNRPGVVLHSGALSARADVNCAIHVHTDAGLAFAARKTGLRMITQNALRFWNRIGYHDYEGLVVDSGEGARISQALGERNLVLIMRNHGLLIVGATVRDAFERTRDLLIAMRVQLMIEATGDELVEVPPEICDKVVLQWEEHDRGRGSADWPAWRRRLRAN